MQVRFGDEGDGTLASNMATTPNASSVALSFLALPVTLVAGVLLVMARRERDALARASYRACVAAEIALYSFTIRTSRIIRTTRPALVPRNSSFCGHKFEFLLTERALLTKGCRTTRANLMHNRSRTTSSD